MAEVAWSESAYRQLERSLGYIAIDAPQAAEKLRLQIEKRTIGLAVTPLIGRVVPDFDRADIREIYVRPFRVLYQVRKKGL
jgi:plasmid stabilization system protein ParE